MSYFHITHNVVRDILLTTIIIPKAQILNFFAIAVCTDAPENETSKVANSRTNSNTIKPNTIRKKEKNESVLAMALFRKRKVF